jgi:hypothetical protein
MAGYSKLDCGIVDSSLWEMPHEYLRVWIAMLAKTDATGYVRVAAPAMARLCHLTREDFDRIIDAYCAPDPESRTADHEGRRLEKVEGGWLILNYLKYREGLKQPDHSTNRVKKHRDKQKECNGSTVSETDETFCNAYAEAEAKADAKAKAVKKKTPLPPKGDASVKMHSTGVPMDILWKESFEKFWDIYPKKRGKDPANKAWDKLKGDEELYYDICEAVIAWRETEDWLKNDGQFVPNASTFLNQKRWQDEIPAAKPINRACPKWMAENDDYTAIGGTKGLTLEEYDVIAKQLGWDKRKAGDE